MDGAPIPAADLPLDEVVTTRTPDGLRAIAAPEGVAGVVWSRDPARAFQDWIDGLDPAQLPSARVILPPAAVPDALPAIFDSSGTPPGPQRDMLAGDVSALAQIFGDLTGAPWLRLRFDVVRNNACSKFHLDAVTVRLVCTYRGQGTQYGTAIAHEDPARVHTVPTGSPILLRGTLWPGSAGIRLRHRSPPIEGTGETRLVLVLDPLMSPEGEV